MAHYKSEKISIDASRLVEVIIDVGVKNHDLPNSIVTNKSFLLTSKFWSPLYYFFGIKRRLATAFYPQTDGQTE